MRGGQGITLSVADLEFIAAPPSSSSTQGHRYILQLKRIDRFISELETRPRSFARSQYHSKCSHFRSPRKRNRDVFDSKWCLSP